MVARVSPLAKLPVEYKFLAVDPKGRSLKYLSKEF